MDEKFIPKLRFNGFNENWNEDKFENIFDIKNGLNKGKDYFGKGIQILNYMDVNNYELNTENTIKGLVELNDEEIKRYSVKPNDLFFTRTSETSEEIGLTSAYVGKEIKCVFSGFLLRARPKMDVNSLFFAYYFRSPKQRNNIIKFSSITTRALISGGNLSKMKIKFPNIGEQNKITKLFLILNKKIELLEKKYQYYQDFKKYLMQQIFTQKLRFQDFTDDWVVTTLDKIAIKIGDGLHSTPDYVENSNYYFINGNNLLEGQIIINDNTKCIPPYEFEKYNNNLNKNTILISINGTIGNLAYYNDEKVILGKSAAYIKLNENIEKEYIYNYLKIGKIQHYFSSELTGTTIKNLSLKTLKNTPIIIPSYNEQKIIANMFKNIDLKIDLINNRLTNMKNFKKGLLQQMFI